MLFEYCYNPTTNNGRPSVSKGDYSQPIKGCQTISPLTNHRIISFSSYWFKNGVPDGTLRCRLETTVWSTVGGGHWEPSGVVLEISATTFNVTTFATGSPYTLCDFVFAGTTLLTVGTTYAIVFYGEGFTQRADNNYVRMRGVSKSGGGDGYVRGTSGSYSTSWLYMVSTDDVWFEESGNPVSVFEISGTSNGVSVLSGTLTKHTLPQITNQSANSIVIVNAEKDIFVSAIGTPTPNYQWYKDGALLSGEIADTLTFYASESAVYRCRVYNITGGVWSNDIVITTVINSSKPQNIFNLPIDLEREDI